MNELEKCKNGEHYIKVWFCKEEPLSESCFLGVCLVCGLTMTVPVSKIEEAFQHV